MQTLKLFCSPFFFANKLLIYWSLAVSNKPHSQQQCALMTTYYYNYKLIKATGYNYLMNYS